MLAYSKPLGIVPAMAKTVIDEMQQKQRRLIADEISRLAKLRGRRGGRMRMTSMTPAERSKISRLGGLARGRKLAKEKS